MQRRHHLDRYAGDLLWRIAQGVNRNEDLVPYSECMDIIDGKKQYRTVKQKVNNAVENMINMFLPQKEKEV